MTHTVAERQAQRRKLLEAARAAVPAPRLNGPTFQRRVELAPEPPSAIKKRLTARAWLEFYRAPPAEGTYANFLLFATCVAGLRVIGEWPVYGFGATDVTIMDVLRKTAHYYGLTVKTLTTRSRTEGVLRPRQVAALICCEWLDVSYSQIGRYMNRDHTTVLYSEAQARVKYTTQASFRHEVDELRKFLGLPERHISASRPPRLKRGVPGGSGGLADDRPLETE